MTTVELLTLSTPLKSKKIFTVPVISGDTWEKPKHPFMTSMSHLKSVIATLIKEHDATFENHVREREAEEKV
jgi:hypothetical protein